MVNLSFITGTSKGQIIDVLTNANNDLSNKDCEVNAEKVRASLDLRAQGKPLARPKQRS